MASYPSQIGHSRIAPQSTAASMSGKSGSTSAHRCEDDAARPPSPMRVVRTKASSSTPQCDDMVDFMQGPNSPLRRRRDNSFLSTDSAGKTGTVVAAGIQLARLAPHD
jgi:hypothetical protein